jgi:hypothetical protein
MQCTFCYSFPCLPNSSPDVIPYPRSLGPHVSPPLLFNPFAFKLLRTLLRHGRPISAFLSITSALFPSRRRVYGGLLFRTSNTYALSPYSLSFHTPLPRSGAWGLHFHPVRRSHSLFFHTLPNSFALFCNFLHSPKTQPFSFHAIPNSFTKTPGVYRRCFHRALRAARSTSNQKLSLDPNFFRIHISQREGERHRLSLRGLK